MLIFATPLMTSATYFVPFTSTVIVPFASAGNFTVTFATSPTCISLVTLISLAISVAFCFLTENTVEFVLFAYFPSSRYFTATVCSPAFKSGMFN